MANEAPNRVELAVVRWSAWAADIGEANSGQEWAAGAADLSSHSEKPDVSFVPAMQRRRLSAMSRMAFNVTTTCLDDGPLPDAYVYCSRYGEYERSFEILTSLARQEEVSPAAFSLSVHNTAASLFSIYQKDPTTYTALSAGSATLEAAYLEAWSILKSQEACRVLLVYHDEPLPPLYGKQETNVTQKFALALVLQPCDMAPKSDRLQLLWQASVNDLPLPKEASDPARRVLELLIYGGDSVQNDTGRLAWSWVRSSDSA